jgi:enterochelin esterase-like enzyme
MKFRLPAHVLFKKAALFALLGLLAAGRVRAQDGPDSFTLRPYDAPDMMLEAVNAGTTDGTAVSIGVPLEAPKQKWKIVSKGDNAYVIRPSYSSTLVLAPKPGGKGDGTPVVLQTENDQPGQLWSIQENAKGLFALMSQALPGKALDNRGGGSVPGNIEDVWEYNPKSQHFDWIIVPLDGAKLPFATTTTPMGPPMHTSAISPPPPPETPLPNVPKGVMKTFTIDQSAIFPGTKREGDVFIPAQYDGSKPACVFVQQDGYRPNSQVKEELEQLIAAKEMPVTIAIFIHPGMVPAPIPGTFPRPNRGYEYDGISNNYVRFLTEELLPYVQKTFHLNLSPNAADHCIVGGSSGGIAAFNAAWQRPDVFSRVYAGSGSFSDFRGGNEFPILIRKFEAKPIRVYMTTGTMDMENAAGDWFLFDQEIDKALVFSGYDVSYHVVEGHHGAGYADHFYDAMRFLWKDWPAPIVAGSSAPRVRDIITDGENWTLAAQGYQDARSPACNSKGEIFFVDPPVNKVYRLGLDGKVSVFLDDAAHGDGLAIGPKDELYTVSSVTGKVMSYDASGQGRVVVGDLPGKYVLARPDGSLYVTTGTRAGGQVWHVKDGDKKLVDSGLKDATGLAYRPDQWLLAVGDGGSKWAYSYVIGPDGSLSDKEPYFRLQVADWDDDAGAESICYAQEGQILIATRSGIQACAADGPTQVVLPMPDRSRPIGVALGGPGMHTLFAFCGGKVWSRVVKIHGIGAFSPMIPVKGSPL